MTRQSERYDYAPDSLRREEPASNALGCPFMGLVALGVVMLIMVIVCA